MKDRTTIELPERTRHDAIVSIKRYFDANLDGEIGDLPAGLLLDFFLEEIGPVVYNLAVREAQQRMQVKVMDLDSEAYVDEFQYWPRLQRKRR